MAWAIKIAFYLDWSSVKIFFGMCQLSTRLIRPSIHQEYISQSASKCLCTIMHESEAVEKGSVDEMVRA